MHLLKKMIKSRAKRVKVMHSQEFKWRVVEVVKLGKLGEVGEIWLMSLPLKK